MRASRGRDGIHAPNDDESDATRCIEPRGFVVQRMKTRAFAAIVALGVNTSAGSLTSVLSIATPSKATSLSIYELNYLLARLTLADVMRSPVITIAPDAPLFEAAELMAEQAVRHVLVLEQGHLVGILSNRDLVRATLRHPQQRLDLHGVLVRDVMSADVKYCFEDDDTEQVARNMGDQQVRRLPVVNREKRLVGILSLSDMTAGGDGRSAGEALAEISQNAGKHSQTQ